MNLAVAETKITFQSFLNSTTLLSKAVFTLLVIFVFFVVLKFSIYFIPKVMNSDSHSPYLVNGTIDGTNSVISSVPILRSVNEENGVEFTWSTWLFINDESIDDMSGNIIPQTTYHIFHKGDDHQLNALDQTYPIACPGVYIKRATNSMIINMNSFAHQINTITIDNIPVYKWFNLIIRVKNKTVDVYINGFIKKSMELDSLPKQNNGKVFICQNKFKGKISNLRYFDEALNIVQIEKIISLGYNDRPLNVIRNTTSTNTSTSYLGYNWYL
jgi:hypothetical protein